MIRVPDHDYPSLLLARGELLAVLEVLQARFIPGLDEEAVAALPPGELQVTLVDARRNLLERGLAQEDDSGALRLHRALLTTVGACAYSQEACLAYHYPIGSDAATPFFGHLRDETIVAHTRPGPALHRFTLLPSPAALVDALLDGCEVVDPTEAQPLEFVLSRGALAEARLLAEAGQAEAATARLLAANCPEQAARALVQTLTARPRVSALQVLTQPGSEAVRSREFTLLQDGSRLWFLSALSANERAPLLARTVTRAALREAMGGWLS